MRWNTSMHLTRSLVMGSVSKWQTPFASPEGHISQANRADIDISHHDQQEGQRLQPELMNHHRLLQKQYEDLLNHHYLVLELYANLMAHPYLLHGENQVLREYHQALQDHHRMVEEHQQALQDHYQMMR